MKGFVKSHFVIWPAFFEGSKDCFTKSLSQKRPYVDSMTFLRNYQLLNYQEEKVGVFNE